MFGLPIREYTAPDLEVSVAPFMTDGWTYYTVIVSSRNGWIWESVSQSYWTKEEALTEFAALTA